MTREENELLTQTDPGTTMGVYLRSFWIPCMVLHEVPAADEPPVRLRLLGEDLVVFRDSSGKVGVIEELCPHRLASLFFGRNEEGGIRCVYHGWKFDTAGTCLEMPNEPPESTLKDKVRAVTYAAREAGGLLWVFMGAQDKVPAMPDFEWLGLPPEKLYASRWEQECNSVQAMEGELDAAHVSFLHRRVDRLDERKNALSGSYFQEDRAPRWHVKDTDYGFIAASERRVEGEQSYWRLNQFLLPFYTMITSEPGNARMTRMWVPKDDTHCWVIAVNFRHEHPLGEQELANWRNGVNTHRKVIPGTTQPVETKANDYLIDRDAQRRLSFTGIAGVRAQDAMATETSGPIVDRTREHLGSSDIAVVKMRRRLLSEARMLRDGGAQPLGAANGKLYRVRAHQSVLDRGTMFDQKEEIIDAMRS
jgi:phenylpropionate dioxygenase-like ring-hydroxylating dioxygenase large terminal subunit